MTRMVQCVKMGKELEGLDRLTYPGDLGKKVFESVSKQGWAEWVKQQTILMNEYRLTPVNPEHRKFLEEEMDKFFFGDGGSAVNNFVPK
ncbi:MAG: oxidative damage protection protein [Thiotrichaceae bacterium]|nr:oxidative damage protection protein [Thiotrichaceae bacterium]